MGGQVIRLAIISGLRQRRLYLEAQFSNLEGIEVVYKGQNPTTNFKSLVRANPNLVFILTGEPNTFAYELIPQRISARLTRWLPEAKILISTEHEKNHPFVRAAIETGISVIDERLDFLKAAEAMRRVISGEQVIMYAEAKRHDLETYRPRLKEAI